jgi:hypothetical protein
MMVVQGMCLRHQWYWQYEEVEVVPVRNMLTTIEMCAWGFLDFVIPFRRVGCDVVTSCGRFERKKWTGEYISVPSPEPRLDTSHHDDSRRKVAHVAAWINSPWCASRTHTQTAHKPTRFSLCESMSLVS